MLCLVDDAQWLDVPSADSLVFAARRLGAEGVVILFAAREGERRRFDGRRARRAGARRARLDLGRRVARPRRPASWPRRCVTGCLADAAGNPLALLELPRLPVGRAARRPGQNARRAAAERAPAAGVPAADRALARGHAAALLLAAAEDARRACDASSAAAAELRLPEDALDAAERAGLIETDGAKLTFRHPLVRSAVYESATSGERRRAHAALAARCAGGRARRPARSGTARWRRWPQTRRSRRRSRRRRSDRSCAAVTPRRRPRSSARRS